MNHNLVIRKAQLDAANRVLAEMSRSVAPEFLGLVSTNGHPIAAHTSQMTTDTDSLASTI